MTKFLAGSEARAFDETRDLSPWALEEYLSLSDWIRVDGRAGLFSEWVSGDERASVMVPYDASKRDYPQRLADALLTLSELTSLEGETLALEIISARKDVFLVRSDQETPDGSIPFREALHLVAGVETMLRSAAASALRPRASTAGPKPRAVKTFIDEDVRMGHTLRGSFVLTVLAADADEERQRHAKWSADRFQNDYSGQPSPQEDAATELILPSFSRQAMTQMATGLRYASELVYAPSSTSLEEAVEEGMTMQMLESVQSMTRSDDVRSLDLNFRWSRVEPSYKELPNRVQIGKEAGRVLPEIVERLRKRPEIIQEAVSGQVIRLERAEGAEDGVVVIEGYVGKDRRKVRVPLSGNDYREAISAHDRGVPVRVLGTLIRRERGWRMEPGATMDQYELPPDSSNTESPSVFDQGERNGLI